LCEQGKVKLCEHQHIMMLEKNINNPKIQFYKTIKEKEAQLQPTCTEKQIILNSFIMSGTPAADASSHFGVKRPEFENRNVLFLEDDDCIEKMMSKICLECSKPASMERHGAK